MDCTEKGKANALDRQSCSLLRPGTKPRQRVPLIQECACDGLAQFPTEVLGQQRAPVSNRQPLRPKGEEVANDRAIPMMPELLWSPAFLCDDVEKLAPKREFRDRRNMAKL
ncbi:hypothetical protein FOMG_19127 [Fusarium oxysporum f. sp. melonis 26406]|uniref:Uncharacterized protein n=1 Tax=Fusarium oxysporum f. sp. melonis 26406 TaxID=1089452 RepID=W9YX54_FUSOX|nr:hypothetical protein FOMG_19127 [Fusarium oxysporum f. sp. melonis 26406]